MDSVKRFLKTKHFTKNLCWRSRYEDPFGKRWRLLTDFKGTIRQYKVFRCIFTSKGNSLNIWKPQFLKKKMHVSRVDVDMWFANFAIEYRKRKSYQNRFACSYGAQVEYFKQQKMVKKSHDNVLLICTLKFECIERIRWLDQAKSRS